MTDATNPTLFSKLVSMAREEMEDGRNRELVAGFVSDELHAYVAAAEGGAFIRYAL